MRYEETEVESESLVRIGQTISWDAANEFNIGFAADQDFDSGTGKYDYVLPSLDLKLDIKDNLVVRASYSETIGRPGWNDIQGGANLAGQLGFDGGTGSSGDPRPEAAGIDQLRPVAGVVLRRSQLRFGWAISARKSPTSSATSSPPRRRSTCTRRPAARTGTRQSPAGCNVGDRPCIRNYIFANHDGAPGVTQTGIAGNGDRQGTIIGQPTDPIATFQMTRPANMRSDELDGWEFNLQHMFGDSGFGVSANYTMVDSGFKYNDTDTDESAVPDGGPGGFVQRGGVLRQVRLAGSCGLQLAR